MIKLTPELEQKIKESGIPIKEITLEDLLKAKPLSSPTEKK